MEIMQLISNQWDVVNIKKSNLPIMVKMKISVSRCKTIMAERGNNRKLTPNTVIKYKREMEMGNWRPGASVIHFDKDGVLIDGQHTTAGAIAANVPLETIVFFGSTEEDIKVLDTGKERKAKDRKAINGIDLSETAMITMRFYAQSLRAMAQMPSSIEDAMYDKYKEGLEFVCSRMDSKGNLGQTGTRMALVKAYYHYGAEMVERFVSVITSGLPDKDLGLDARDPAFALRNWLLIKSAEGKKRREVFSRSLFAVRAFEEGKGIKRMTRELGASFLPLPDEAKYIPRPEILKVCC